MKAIGLTSFGGPDALKTFDLPAPEPGAAQVRVSVRAAGVNPTDITFRSGGRAAQLADRPTPWVPGMDLAGVIDELGPGGDDGGRLAVGDRVVGLVIPFGLHGGAYAEQVVVDARSVVAAPDGVEFNAAATLLLNALTADLALEAIGATRGADDAFGITGAIGGVGGFAVELAKYAGIHTVADASAKDDAAVRALGATEIVERGPRFAAAVHEAHSDGLAGVLDAAGLSDPAIPAIRDGGVIAELKGQQPGLERGITLAAISSFGSVTDTNRLDRLARLAEHGHLTLRVAEVLKASDAARAHRMLEAGGVRGRLVLSFD